MVTKKNRRVRVGNIVLFAKIMKTISDEISKKLTKAEKIRSDLTFWQGLMRFHQSKKIYESNKTLL